MTRFPLIHIPQMQLETDLEDSRSNEAKCIDEKDITSDRNTDLAKQLKEKDLILEQKELLIEQKDGEIKEQEEELETKNTELDKVKAKIQELTGQVNTLLSETKMQEVKIKGNNQRFPAGNLKFADTYSWNFANIVMHGRLPTQFFF